MRGEEGTYKIERVGEAGPNPSTSQRAHEEAESNSHRRRDEPRAIGGAEHVRGHLEQIAEVRIDLPEREVDLLHQGEPREQHRDCVGHAEAKRDAKRPCPAPIRHHPKRIAICGNLARAK